MTRQRRVPLALSLVPMAALVLGCSRRDGGAGEKETGESCDQMTEEQYIEEVALQGCATEENCHPDFWESHYSGELEECLSDKRNIVESEIMLQESCGGTFQGCGHAACLDAWEEFARTCDSSKSACNDAEALWNVEEMCQGDTSEPDSGR